MLNAYVFNWQEVSKDCPILKEVAEKRTDSHEAWFLRFFKRFFIYTDEKLNLVRFLGYDDGGLIKLFFSLEEGKDDYILKQIVEELVKARKKFGQNIISIFNACFKEEKASENRFE